MDGEDREPNNKNIETNMMDSYFETNVNVNKNIENRYIIDEANGDKPNKTGVDEIFDIIDNLNNDTDLNNFIDNINRIRVRDNKRIFDKNQMLVSFSNKEVDKFLTAKRQHKNFSVDISFRLL